MISADCRQTEETVISLGPEHGEILEKMRELYADLFFHQGFGNFSVEMRFLKKGQKEVILHCGKEYRYVVDYPDGHSCPRCARRANNEKEVMPAKA